MNTDAWGIEKGYADAYQTWRPLSDATLRLLRDAVGAPSAGRATPAPSAVRVVRPGSHATWTTPGRLVLEDGGKIEVDGCLPADLPCGYHRFVPQGSDDELLLIATPGVCELPRQRPGWGWSVQLYAARSRESWGVGDLADLRQLAKWSSRLGASLLLINPLDAVAPTLPQEGSPYFPSSRRFRNPLYLRIPDAPGAAELADSLRGLEIEGQALNANRRIDRDQVFRLKMRSLETLWSRFGGDERFERYRLEPGRALDEFAAYCVLSEEHGRDWRTWPTEYRTFTNPAVKRFVDERQSRARFHQWLQWLLDEQLAAASSPLAVVQDLPIGIDPGGADAWVWQDVLAQGVSVGAPPDVYNTLGQNWGLPPWIPHKLQAADYRPFIETIRAALRHAGGLRIDHVMGLFRLFWIPEGLPPAEGGYVRYPYEELLAIIALESHRAGAFIVGEDLGTTEPIVGEQLSKHRILSYRVMWFEEDRPATYPELSVAAVTTHDLPTIAGLWTGDDLRGQQALGLAPNVDATLAIRDRLKKMARLSSNAPIPTVIERTHKLLAEAGSMIVAAALDDALAVTERANMPATTTSYPNWSVALPKTIEEIEAAPLPQSIARVLTNRKLHRDVTKKPVRSAPKANRAAVSPQRPMPSPGDG